MSPRFAPEYALVCFLMASFTLHAVCQVTQLPAEPDVLCMSPSPEAGKKAEVDTCAFDRGYDYTEDVGGRLRNGDCVICGRYEDPYPIKLRDGECKKGTTAISYVSGSVRRCACQVGFYGNQTANTCRACPTGSTTQGVGATSIRDCNICDTGYTGTNSSRCVACPKSGAVSLTTSGPGLNRTCVCPIGYTGRPGSCTKCRGSSTTAAPGSQTCICPAGGRVPNCKKCDKGVVLNGKCECLKGTTGVWPRCSDCPKSNGYDMTTLRAGNSQTCVCDVFGGLGESSIQAMLVERDNRTGRCNCRESRGYYLKVVQNWNWNSEMSNGPCDSDRGLEPTETKVITLNGTRVTACKNEIGLGVNVAYAASYDDTPYCLNCTAVQGAYIDRTTTKCLCGPGYGVNLWFGSYSVSAHTYCRRCAAPAYRLGTAAPNFVSGDQFCVCGSGYVWDKTKDICVKAKSG